MRTERLLALVEKTPHDAELHYMLAMEYKSTRRFSDALTKLDDCLRLNPNYVPAYYQKAVVCQADGQIESARKILAEGMIVAGRNGNLHARDEMRQLLATLE